VTAEAVAGGKATFSVEGVAKDVPMNPVAGAPAKYVGKHTVAGNVATNKATVKVDFVDADGRVFSAAAAVPVAIATRAPRTPIFANLTNGDRVKSPLVLSGATSPDAVVAVKIIYTFQLLGFLPQTGVLANVETTADKTGQYKTDPIDLSIPHARKDITYAVTAIARNASGRESEPAKLELKSER
jgi:hypothetical protein